MPGGDTRSITFFEPFPLALARGEGCRIWDADGTEFIDALNNYTALVHGHAAPAILSAIAEQAPYGTVFPAPHELQAEVAERLCARVDSVERVRFANSGTEAVMLALRAARAITGRDEIVKAEGGYHGSWEQVPMSVGGPGIPRAVEQLVHMVTYNDVASLETAMRARGNRVAALIFEPVLGRGGIVGNPAFFAAARRLADEYGALLVLDEVVTLRLAWGGFQSVLGVAPDLTTFGKIIGGGLPVGAVGGPADVMAVFDPRRERYVQHAGTFNGNPMTMAAGRASLDLLSAAEIGRINALGEQLAGRLRAALTASGLGGDVAGYGSFLHLHVPVPQSAMHLACLDERVYIAPRGMLNLSTPMDDAVIEEIARGVGRAATRLVEAEPPRAQVAPRG
jgi:glutamate-1-semialdehyde 2,1-aminomutase